MSVFRAEVGLATVEIHPVVMDFINDLDNSERQVESRVRDFVTESLKLRVPSEERISDLITRALTPDSDILLLGTRRPFASTTTHHWSPVEVISFTEAMENITRLGVYKRAIKKQGERQFPNSLMSAVPRHEEQAGILTIYQTPFSKKRRWISSLRGILILTNPQTDPEILSGLYQYLGALKRK